MEAAAAPRLLPGPHLQANIISICASNPQPITSAHIEAIHVAVHQTFLCTVNQAVCPTISPSYTQALCQAIPGALTHPHCLSLGVANNLTNAPSRNRLGH